MLASADTSQSWHQLLDSVRAGDQPLLATSRRASRLGVFEDIFVLSLKRRYDRRERMETLRSALGLNWTYAFATEAADPKVSLILDHIRAVRANYTQKDFFWPPPPPPPGPDLLMSLAGAELWVIDPSDPHASSATPPSDQEYLPEIFLGDFTPFGKGALMTRPRIATYLSHMNLVRRIADAPDANYSALILEDDVDADWNIQRTVRRVWDAHHALPEDWDMVYLGHCPPIGHDADARNSEAHFPHVPGAPELRPSRGPWCTHAYALSRNGARRLLTHMRYELFAFSRPVDNAYVHLIMNNRVKSFTFLPPVVVQVRDGVSDIWGTDMTGKVSKDDLVDSTLERIALARLQQQPAQSRIETDVKRHTDHPT
ncbi:hypothetical protein BKA62DRAFT_624302 [Auriculariales sp. MPI-PUGE-AT-0066]|nr:hypothetical protein BKA62DRAFT_624302 [Auriculariales sp. MPI-PUGE-AT-0066]